MTNSAPAGNIKRTWNIRWTVLTFSIVYSIVAYALVFRFIESDTLRLIRITQVYALTALFYLYMTLLAGPLCFQFPALPFRGQYLKARRSLGVSAWYFGLLHALFAFFGLLGGLDGLGYLGDRYLFAIMLSFTALVILTVMASISFDRAIALLTFKTWKRIHRFVYLASFLILVHALMLGTHFANFSQVIPQIFISALGILLLLEARRVDAFLQKKFTIHRPGKSLPSFGIIFVLVAAMIIAYFFISFFPTGLVPSLNIHRQHGLINPHIDKV